MKPILILGEVLFDCFEDGKRVLGGAPFNVAWHLQGMGLQPSFVSTLGQDEAGREVRQSMQRWGMNQEFLSVHPTLPTGFVQVGGDPLHPQFDIKAPQAWDVLTLPPSPAADTILYHGTLALRQHHNRSHLRQWLTHFHGSLFLDLNLRTPWWQHLDLHAWIANARFLKCNQEELDLLVPNLMSAKEKVTCLFHQTPLEAVILTRGQEGALLYRPGTPPLQVRPKPGAACVDTVGAGDAFSAVCLKGILLGRSWEETMVEAQLFASAIVAHQGATSDQSALYRPHRLR
jgi:fructokinase